MCYIDVSTSSDNNNTNRRLNTRQNVQVGNMMEFHEGISEVRILYSQSEGWDPALDSSSQLQIQSFDVMSSFNVTTEYDSRDIAAAQVTSVAAGN